MLLQCTATNYFVCMSPCVIKGNRRAFEIWMCFTNGRFTECMPILLNERVIPKFSQRQTLQLQQDLWFTLFTSPFQSPMCCGDKKLEQKPNKHVDVFGADHKAQNVAFFPWKIDFVIRTFPSEKRSLNLIFGSKSARISWIKEPTEQSMNSCTMDTTFGKEIWVTWLHVLMHAACRLEERTSRYATCLRSAQDSHSGDQQRIPPDLHPQPVHSESWPSCVSLSLSILTEFQTRFRRWCIQRKRGPEVSDLRPIPVCIHWTTFRIGVNLHVSLSPSVKSFCDWISEQVQDVEDSTLGRRI